MSSMLVFHALACLASHAGMQFCRKEGLRIPLAMSIPQLRVIVNVFCYDPPLFHTRLSFVAAFVEAHCPFALKDSELTCQEKLPRAQLAEMDCCLCVRQCCIEVLNRTHLSQFFKNTKVSLGSA